MAILKDAVGKSGILTDGDWILSENMQDAGSIGVIQLKHIGVGEFLHKSFNFISEATFENLKCTEVLPGDVLISRMADPIARACIVPKLPFRCVTAVDIAILRVDNQVADANYLKFLCNSSIVKNQAEELGRGTTRLRITRKELEKLEIPLPPLAEQQRIAGILARADRLRQLRRYALQLSEGYLQSVFLQMFGDPVTNPMGWETSLLKQLCQKIVDCPHSTPKYERVETPYACVRSSDIQNGFFDWSTTKYVSIEEYQIRSQRLKPIAGDVVYCREGARFGNAARIPCGKTICLGQRTMLFRANPKVATPEFIWAYLESDSAYEQAVKLSGGSASPHVNVGDIKAFRVTIPPIEKQHAFSRVVHRFERLRAQQHEAARQAEHLFATLLHRAFTPSP